MAQILNRSADLLNPFLSGLTHWDLIEIYTKMLTSRAMSERMWLLNRMGKAHIIVTAEGHEAAQVGSAYAIRKGYDFALPYYRDLGVVLTLGMTPKEVMLGTLNKAADPNGGRQMPGHWSYPKLNIVSHSSVIATQLLHAVGIAHANQIKGEDRVAVVYFGEGATSKGDFHEALNWAGIYNLPVVFICENNGYAISLPSTKQTATPQIADRAQSYGSPGITIDGFDAMAVYEATQEAISRAREGHGPTLIEAMVYRYMPHTSNDDDSNYRSREEVDAWKARDPIPKLRDHLVGMGVLSEEEDASIRETVAREINEATEFAEQSPAPKGEDALRHVFSDEAA